MMMRTLIFPWLALGQTNRQCSCSTPDPLLLILNIIHIIINKHHIDTLEMLKKHVVDVVRRETH